MICDAGAPQGEKGQPPRAHSIRSMSTSVAFHGNWNVGSILKAATWKYPSVFTSFYLRDIEFQIDDVRSLGPFTAAGEIVQYSNQK